MNDFRVFMPIAKLDKENRTVSGYASTPAKDSDGEIVTLQAIKKALPGYMAWGNIREMHKLSAVGSAQEANIDAKGLFLTAKIVDDAAWKKCVEGVYKGFSIGGRKLDKSGNKITEIDMTEISVVDRPANPECSFALAKREKDVEVSKAEGFLIKLEKPAKPSPEARALSKMAKIVGTLAKAGPPAAKDGLSLPAVPNIQPDGTMSHKDSRPNENVTRKTDDDAAPCEAHGKIGCEKCAAAKTQKLGDSSRPYGDVTYADDGLRPDGKKRYPIDTADHIRAAWNYIHKKKNAGKYTDDDLAKVKAKIVAAWKAHVNAEGPPSMDGESKTVGKSLVPEDLFKLSGGGFLDLPKADALHKVVAAQAPAPQGALPSFLTLGKAAKPLRKSMRTAGSLSYVFDSLRDAQRSLLMEGKREGGDKRDKGLADRLGAIAKELSGVISQKATHEGEEATTLTDADDMFTNRMLGAETMSTPMNYAAGGDPLTNAILDVVKRAAMPTKAQMMKEAGDNVKECRKAAKAAREMIEDCHKMHKAAFLAKTEKAAKGDKGGEEFDHAGAMEKLQKAYAEIDKARMLGKAAMAKMEKVSRAGQKGQEVSDPESPFYEVPPGIKDLTPEMMATLSPAGSGKGSQPLDYGNPVVALKGEGQGDLAKFAKNGMVSAEVMQLLLEKAQTDGELAALRRLPMSVAGGRRPMAFNTQRLLGDGQGGHKDVGALNKALFDGVDVGALNGQDERTHTEASARAIGNFIQSGLFGKSVFDPAFKGGAALGG